MFYRPCLAALYGMNRSEGKEMDPRYFFVDPWYNHEECTRTRCLERADMAWDRKNGECVDGILGRKGFIVKSDYDEDEDQYCALTINNNGAVDCKNTPDTHTLSQIDVCRENLVSDKQKDYISLSYLMDHFCMPQLAFNEAEANMAIMDRVDLVWNICSSGNQYPYCNVTGTNPTFLNDGFCDLPLDVDNCDYDGHDCDDFNAQYINCEVDYPYLVGNGYCDGGKYDIIECGYDGGDCEYFHKEYPDCIVDRPFSIGDGFCDGGDYNTIECGWDGGDCDDLVNL